MWKVTLLQTLLSVSFLLPPHSTIEINSTVPLSRPKRGVFDGIRTGIDAGGLAYEIAQLGHQGSKKAVAITNEADGWFRIWCASKDDDIGEHHLYPGRSMTFSFRPWIIGTRTVFWCTLDLKHFWARWDVYNDFAPYINVRDKVYQYIVRNDGVYINGRKISSLESGHHRYVLWENYDDNKNPHGASLTGYVDGGVCNNLPGWMADKASVVTVCDHQCVILYEHIHCGGHTSRLQAQGGCTNFWLSYFNDKTSSVKGC